MNAPTSAHTEGARIGVFDSGLGGLSVLRALRVHLPQARLLYVADSGFAPYGERSADYIAQRVEVISAFLMSQGAQAIVVACNTATAAAVHLLRERHPSMPIVGVEPGVKPALALSPGRRVGVLATPGTLSSEKFQHLIARHGHDALILPVPCPGLAREIELGQLDTPSLRQLVATFAAPLRAAQVDTVVLGCTHYPFVAPLFQAELGPGVRLVDTADAVARQTARLCEGLHATGHDGLPGSVALWTTGEPAHLSRVAQQWLHLDTPAQALP